MPRTATLIAIFALSLATATTAMADGNAAAGKKKSQTCAACHGAKGNTDNGMYPKLAGQHESYLYHSLRAYKSGDRKNAIMSGMVASLSDQDMHDLAAYFSSVENHLHTLPMDAPSDQ